MEKSKSQVAIIGAGLSGIAMAIKLKKLGIDDFVIFERASGVGGTWRANAYPGCSVDVPGPSYSFSFAPNPNYSNWFPKQPEVLDYIKTIAESSDTNRHVKFSREFLRGAWSESRQLWSITVRNVLSGEEALHKCSILISAIGGLVHPNRGGIRNLEKFRGEMIHTGEWDRAMDFQGKCVIVVGNGCSAAQIIPAIAEETQSIYQFMSSPQSFIPSRNIALPTWYIRLARAAPIILVILRWVVFLLGELGFIQYTTSYLGNRIRTKAEVRGLNYVKWRAPLEYWSLLFPEHAKGCKRVVRDHGYFDALHRENVHLIRERVSECFQDGIITESGKLFSADIIILATGFDREKNFLDLEGRGGTTISQHMSHLGGTGAYKSISMSGFPNFFMLYGPNAAFAHSSNLIAIESAVELIIRVSRPVLLCRVGSVDVDFDAELCYVQNVRAALRERVWVGCKSYYKDGADQNTFLYPWSAFSYFMGARLSNTGAWRYNG